MKLKNWIFQSLRTKLLVMFVTLTVIPLVFIGVVSYMKSIDVVSRNAQSFAQLQANEVSQKIDVMFQDVRRFKEISKLDTTIQFLRHEENTYEEAKSILDLFGFYREIFQPTNNILSISIYNLNGKAISEDKGVHQLSIPPRDRSTHQMLIKIPNETLYEPISVNQKPVISITDTIILDLTGEVIGFINILIDASAVESIINEAHLGDTGSFFIETESGESLFKSSNISTGRYAISNWRQVKEKESGFISNHSGNIFTVFDTLETTGWKIIAQVPSKELMQDANDIRTLIIVSVAFSIIFTITLYFFITSKLIRPIRNLKDKMKLASRGDLSVMVSHESSDEIADLGESFNAMIIKIKTLLEKSIEEQKQINIAELKSLQSQINPHFLYNTLDNIIWMAESNKSSEVIEMTKALSNFFRITLSKGKDLITIKEEFEHIHNYLIIQEIRYRDRLEVSINCNEEILNFPILKLTLQPLIENAIYHGIKNKREKGLIIVNGDLDEDKNIRIDIIDNGIGIKEDDLREIQQKLSSGVPLEKNNGGYGMFNVHQRIRLYYEGKEFGLSINSTYGLGTHIRLTIPGMR